MPDSFSDTRIAALEKRKAELIEEYQAANRQLARELDDVNRLKLKRRIEDLEAEIADMERQIETLQGQSVSSRKISAPRPPGQYRVLVDEYHGEHLFTSQNRRRLLSSGFRCMTLKEAYTGKQLSGFDVLAIWFAHSLGGTLPSFSQEELSAISEYLARGGNALLMGLGWAWAQYEKRSMEEYPLNLIAERYGIFFTEATISSVAGVHYTQSPITFSKPFMAEHPITSAVHVIGCPDAIPGSLLVEPPAVQLIWGSNETRDSDGAQNPIVLAAGKAGSGRIVCLQHAGYATHMAYNNFALLKNILEWLVSG